MAILGTWNADRVTLNPKPNVITFSRERGTSTEVVAFDASGRLWTAIRDHISYRRGLDGKIVAKWTDRDGAKNRRWLSDGEARALEQAARSLMIEFLDAYNNGQTRLDGTMTPDQLTLFNQIASFTPERYTADIQRYHQVYSPVGILPPDQYMALVLQATIGCSFNTCTFCDFYKDRPFRIKSLDEFKQHTENVISFLDKGLSLRRTIFLGDANALVIPTPRLISMLEVINEFVDVHSLGGIYGFLDGFSGEKKSVTDYRELKTLGLERVYIGMESGHAPLLRELKKPGTPEDTLQAVRFLKEAGISVGVIILLGAGGHKYAQGHIQDTIQSLNAMHLDMDDIIYFSELIENNDLQYTRKAFTDDLIPLTSKERIAQQVEIESRLRFSQTGGTPHISRYDIREFVY